MAFSTEEIRDSYLKDITKWCPKKRVKRVWVDSVKKRGNISDELVDHLERRRGYDVRD